MWEEGRGSGNVTIYDRYGVPTIINAAGPKTWLGGSLMLPEVVAAMQSASRSFVTIHLSTPVDAGPPDARVDAGVLDTGSPDARVDANSSDGRVDVGVLYADASDARVDAGGLDAESSDGRVDAGSPDVESPSNL